MFSLTRTTVISPFLTKILLVNRGSLYQTCKTTTPVQKEDPLPVMLLVLIRLRLLRDKRVEGMIIRKEICKQFSVSHRNFSTSSFLGNVVAMIDADLAFDTPFSSLLD